MAADIYTRPQAFDVILTSNMFGDILSNLANALAGSLGLASALNVGEKFAAAMPATVRLPILPASGIANPLGIVVPAALLLRWFGETRNKQSYAAAAAAIESAVDASVLEPSTRTGDMEARRRPPMSPGRSPKQLKRRAEMSA